MRDGQSVEQLCLPQRSVKIKIQQKVVIIKIIIGIKLSKKYKLKKKIKKNKHWGTGKLQSSYVDLKIELG